MKILWIFGVGGFLLFIISLILIQGIGIGGEYERMTSILAMFYTLIYFILLASVVSYVFSIIFHEIGKNNKQDSIREDAMMILKNRYAKGELSKDEFEMMKKDIGNYI